MNEVILFFLVEITTLEKYFNHLMTDFHKKKRCRLRHNLTMFKFNEYFKFFLRLF